MRYLPILTTLAFLTASSAHAADMPVKGFPVSPPAVGAWSGWYIGVNGGWGIGMSSQTLTVDALAQLLGATTTGIYEVSGGLIGGTLGYNIQNGPWVLGLQGDMDWSGIRGSVSSPISGTPFTFETDLQWLTTLRARAGIDLGTFVPYVTTGAAFGSVRAKDLTMIGGGNAPAALSEIRMGWTAGAGIEYAIAQNWRVNLEYLYVDLGTSMLFIDNVDFTAHILRGGVNWHF